MSERTEWVEWVLKGSGIAFGVSMYVRATLRGEPPIWKRTEARRSLNVRGGLARCTRSWRGRSWHCYLTNRMCRLRSVVLVREDDVHPPIHRPQPREDPTLPPAQPRRGRG